MLCDIRKNATKSVEKLFDHRPQEEANFRKINSKIAVPAAVILSSFLSELAAVILVATIIKMTYFDIFLG